MEGFQFIDIIFFAMVAAFLVLRLRSVLGRRTGHERPRPDGFSPPRQESGPSGDNVIELPPRRGPGAEEAAYADSPVAAGLERIGRADPGFSPGRFAEGARAAFEMIVGAFAAGDVETLRPLLSKEVLANFEGAVEERGRTGETLETELVSIKSVDLVGATLEGRTATVTVKFVTEQVNAVRDAEGKVIEGDPTRVTEVVDVWSFARDTGAQDPNWLLVATSSPEE